MVATSDTAGNKGSLRFPDPTNKTSNEIISILTFHY